MSGREEESPWRLVRLLAGTLAVTVLLAFLSNLTIEFVQVGGPSYLGERTLTSGRGVFVLGTVVVWILVLLVLAVTGRLWLTCALVAAGTLVISYVNFTKLKLRQEPVFPSDLEFGGNTAFLATMVDVSSVTLLVVGVLALAIVLIAAGRVLSRVFPAVDRERMPRAARGLLITRLVVALAAIGAMAYLAQFNAPGNLVRAAYEAEGAHWKFWYQKLNYAHNGFVGGTLYNLGGEAMAEPAGYGEAAMRDIARRYTGLADDINAQRSGSLDDVNVVLVLAEAFSDPNAIEGVDFAEDPIPFTRSVMESTTSGAMLAQLFGGGTANMEFEVLTGQSLANFTPQMNAPYQQLLPELDSYPSAVEMLRRSGHRAIAVHPYMTTMYQRERVYPMLGFEEFIYDETMESAETIDDGQFISDASAFDEVAHQIEENEQPLLVNLVTMQNHYPMADVYDSPIGVRGAANAEERRQAGGWARGLSHTDRALETFLGDLEMSNEKTVVLFYGDHLPAAWSEETRDNNSFRTLHETTFFAWSNFAAARPDPRPTTSPIHFMNLVHETADAPVPPFYALLAEVERHVPAMERGIMIDADDNLVRRDHLGEEARSVLHDYRLVQYDLSVGRRFTRNEMFRSGNGSDELQP